MHPAALMPYSRVHRPNRRRQAGTAIAENQAQLSSFASAAIEIPEQRLPVGLTCPLAAQESQQVPTAVLTDSVCHQHLHLLAPRRSTHPQAHSVQEQIDIIIAQSRLVKLAHRLVQIPDQLRHGLRTHRLSRDGGHYPAHLTSRNPSQKCFPDEQRDLFGTPLETP